MSAFEKLMKQAVTGATARTLTWSLLCAIAAGLSSVLLLSLSGWFLTAAAAAGLSGAAAVAAFNYLIPSAAIRGLAIIRTVSRYGERLLSHRAALMAMAHWRGRLFGKLAAQDSRTAPDLSGGDASARLIGDIEALEDLIVRRPTQPASLITALFSVALALFAGWKAALALALLLLALPFVLRIAANRWTRPAAAEAVEALGALRMAFVDAAASRPEIIAYGLGQRVTDELATVALRVDRARAALFRGEGVVAGLLVGYGTLTASAILLLSTSSAAFTALALLAATASVEAMAAFARTAVAQATVERGLQRLEVLMQLTGEPQRVVDERTSPQPITLGDRTIAPGSRIAITGRSGSGKTRLVEALAGMRAPVHALGVGNASVADVSPHELSAQFAISPQEATLIAGTVADNLRLARPGIDEAAMRTALHVACLDSRVDAMPDGLNTLIGESGGSLSGGERKRLSLARAILSGRPWLILDEPTEGLDAGTEATLIERLKTWLDQSDSGLILVSHRPAPLILAASHIDIDRIGVTRHAE